MLRINEKFWHSFTYQRYSNFDGCMGEQKTYEHWSKDTPLNRHIKHSDLIPDVKRVDVLHIIIKIWLKLTSYESEWREERERVGEHITSRNVCGLNGAHRFQSIEKGICQTNMSCKYLNGNRLYFYKTITTELHAPHMAVDEMPGPERTHERKSGWEAWSGWQMYSIRLWWW